MRPSRTTMTAFSTGAAPVPSKSRAPTKAFVPSGSGGGVGAHPKETMAAAALARKRIFFMTRALLRRGGDSTATGKRSSSRAAASIDLVHDEADLSKKIDCPLLVLWGERAPMHRLYDVLSTWRESASQVTRKAMPGGHYLPEEIPEETLSELRKFLS
jgi:pimeloyl-ACP methyl ester carboxylesterase